MTKRSQESPFARASECVGQDFFSLRSINTFCTCFLVETHQNEVLAGGSTDLLGEARNAASPV